MMQWVELEGKTPIKIFIDDSVKKGKCKSCGKEFTWGITKEARWMPLIKEVIDGVTKWHSHFADCPDAMGFRR